MPAKPQLTSEQQELLDQLAAVWTTAPSLRLGQILRYAAEQPVVGWPLEAIPVVEDQDIVQSLASLHRQLTKDKPTGKRTEPGA